MKRINVKKGFTLIELLVVVAIIGILASVVLASLNSARTKGSDAAIKAAMSNTRAQAELYYDAGATYAGVCTGANGIGNIVLNAAQKLSITSVVGTASTDVYTYSAVGAAVSPYASVCHDSATAWAAITSLKVPTGSATGGWCVDSTGASKESATLDADVYTCP